MVVPGGPARAETTGVVARTGARLRRLPAEVNADQGYLFGRPAPFDDPDPATSRSGTSTQNRTGTEQHPRELTPPPRTNLTTGRQGPFAASGALAHGWAGRPDPCGYPSATGRILTCRPRPT